MKKKEILRRLEGIRQSINAMFTDDVLNVVSDLIHDIKADMKPEREYLTPVEAITKLCNGEAKKVTNDNNYYCQLFGGSLAWFSADSSYHLTFQVCIANNDSKWWVVE